MSKPRRDAFEALADPTRRRVLAILRDRGSLPAGELAAAFPAISRPAVSRHLRVLRESGLVVATQSGREWRYALGEQAIAELHRSWDELFAPMWDRALQQLKSRVEESPDATATKRTRRVRE